MTLGNSIIEKRVGAFVAWAATMAWLVAACGGQGGSTGAGGSGGATSSTSHTSSSSVSSTGGSGGGSCAASCSDLLLESDTAPYCVYDNFCDSALQAADDARKTMSNCSFNHCADKCQYGYCTYVSSDQFDQKCSDCMSIYCSSEISDCQSN